MELGNEFSFFSSKSSSRPSRHNAKVFNQQTNNYWNLIDCVKRKMPYALPQYRVCQVQIWLPDVGTNPIPRRIQNFGKSRARTRTSPIQVPFFFVGSDRLGLVRPHQVALQLLLDVEAMLMSYDQTFLSFLLVPSIAQDPWFSTQVSFVIFTN